MARNCGPLRLGGAVAAAAGSSAVLSAGLDATVAVVKAVGKVYIPTSLGGKSEIRG